MLGGNVGVINGPTSSGGMMLMKSMIFFLAASVAAFSASILETRCICNKIISQGNNTVFVHKKGIPGKRNSQTNPSCHLLSIYEVGRSSWSRQRKVFVALGHRVFQQANHRMTTNMQRRIYGHATDVGIRPLNEEKAVQAAVDLLGEFFVFSVAVAALVFEVQRNSRSEAKKEELRRQEIEKLRQRDEALQKEMEGLRNKIQELEQLARGRGLVGMFNFRIPHIGEGKSATPA